MLVPILSCLKLTAYIPQRQTGAMGSPVTSSFCIAFPHSDEAFWEPLKASFLQLRLYMHYVAQPCANASLGRHRDMEQSDVDEAAAHDSGRRGVSL